ncbi:MAG: DUF6288 domain-containing protein [Verrucomicrobia bacterium]|nr:DUF6288 domain-containing protein [Verrucomicrobiota bacterium]
MYLTTTPRLLRPWFASISLLLLLAMPFPLRAQAPDLTTTDLSTLNRSWTWNLGPTGMRGWIFHAWPATMNHDDVTAFAPYQILVTTVAAGTPAAGILATDDVILGASAGTGAVPRFTSDARKSLGWAIGDAEAGNGILSFKRWRAGVTIDVSIILPVMGAYSDTAPYNCAKSALIMANAANSLAQRINADGWGQDDGRGAISALALLASGDPAYLPMVQAYARHLAPADYVAGGDAWHFYNGVFLAEYYMLTNDAQVFHALSEYVKYAAKNSDLCGTTGHGFATLPPPGGWVDGHHGSIAPYGALNQAGLIAQLTVVLGKKAGVVDPEIDPAIARAAGFFGYYVNGGSIPYGEHQPWWGEHQIGGQGRQYFDHRSNGKDGLCAVLFSCMDDKPAQAEYFSRMCVAGTRGEAYGHTGQGFAYLWTELGANMGGPAAGAEYAKRVRWDRDMKRRCDGSFVYEGGEQWGAGQAYSGYWDNTYEYWAIPTASYLLHAAMPLKKLHITGKGLIPTNALNAQTVTNAIWAGDFASYCAGYTKEQLIAALGDYDPIVRLNAATELGTRWLSSTELNSLITMAEDPTDAYQRNGACTALGCLKATSAVPALTRRLKDPDKWVRARAALALGQMDEASLASSVPDMADAFISNVTPPLPWNPGFNTDDPLQMANGFLAGTLFGTCANTMSNADRNLLYPAIRVGLQQPTGNCRGQLNGYVENWLSVPDTQALVLDLFEDATVQCPMDTFMGGYPPIAAMNALSKARVQEGLQVIFDNVPFYQSYALNALPNYGEAARWTLSDLYADVANWQSGNSNYTALTNTVNSLEAATTSSVVYALPKADPQILVTPANTAKAITLTGYSCRTTPVTCTVATQPAHGTLTGYPPNLTYTPAAGYQGMDSFTFTAADSLTSSSPATVNMVVGTGGSGLTGSYYDNMDFTSFHATRIDPSVNFDWGATPPNTLGAGTYSVRWTGQALAPETGTYRFSTRTSDGVRLWINGMQVINDWNDQAANVWNDSAAITLTAGHKYHLQMEYYNKTNPATVRLYWYIPSRQSQAAMIIPQELLFPVAGVCLTSPLDGARFGVPAGQTTTVTLTADTSDLAGTVTNVSFYNGGTLIGSDTTAPYSFTWTNVAVGGYDITARATDSTGAVSTSPVASIAVDGYTVPVTAGLACHFDAAVGIATDANGAVKNWQDRSGNGHHATWDNTAWNSGTPTLAANQLMSLPAVQMRGAWFNLAGAFFAKEQYVVVRSPSATWNGSGAFLGRKSYDFLTVRASSYTMTRGGTGFWDMPAAVSRNGMATFNLAPITNYMVLKITVDDNASAANLAAYPYCQIGRTENECGMDWDVAEIIGYSNALSPSDEALVGGYLAAKYGITTTYPATGSLANRAATAITITSAALNATLMCNSKNYDVVAYWGPVNGGMNPANWAHSATIGSWNNVASIDLNHTLTNLAPGTTYYFNFRASNAQHTLWAAAPLSFTTTSTAKDFLTFGANVSGSSATIDAVSGTVAWTVPYGTDLTNLAPAYTVSAQAAGAPASGTSMNFSTPQTYTLTAQDGSTKVHTVTATVDHILPSSINATLTILEDTAMALDASDFGYADPHSSPLAAVRITTLPALGTLKLGGTAVASGDLPLVVAAANIGTLTYQSPLYGYGTPYTTIGIKVRNANNLWSSADAVMTVNVMHVNHPPASTGASFIIKGDSVKTFWKTDFPFSDVDAGERLSAIKVVSLPAHGTLKLTGTPITSVPGAAIPVANIGTLTYTPNPGYVGADPFKFQVSDGTAFSADATMAITVKSPYGIDVVNGSFEITNPGDNTWSDGNWMFIPSPWTANMGNYGRIKSSSASLPPLTDGGTWIANFTDAGFDVVTQNLLTSVSAGDTLAVTFYVGRDSLGSGVLQASFLVDATAYSQTFDTTPQAVNTWKSYTLTKTIIEPGNLSLRFSNVSGRAGWLDNISSVTITSAVVAPGAPSSTHATLAAVGDTATALAAGNFGYSDPGSAALAAVQIVSLPELGTLKYNGTPVTSVPLTVVTANIGNLTYLSASNGYGTPYTRMGVMVKNANNLWSIPAWMTVNVTPLNHAPTSIGGSLVLKPNTVKAFAAGDFPFSDVDASDTLGAIKVVTMLPAHGTLKLGGTPITSVPSAAIPVADIGNLTYTPAADYLGADSFKFQVRDASAFSADATMAITVTSDIYVINGSFETTGAVTDGNWAHLAPVWHPSPDSDYGQSHAGVFFTNAADGTWYANFTDPGFSITQDLLTTVNAGDTLAVTFHVGKDNTTSGTITATFMVGSTPYSQNFDTTSQSVGTWAPYTLTTTLANAGNLSLMFSSSSGRVWLDKISNIAVTPTDAPSSTHATLTVFEDTAIALAAGNFGYADPNSAALAAVRITSLPALGTLKLSGTPVSSGALPLTIAAANIGTLTYQAALNANSDSYTTLGIKVANANGLWSIADAVMTVNVTPVNDAPTSTGASASLPTGTVKSFAAGDFPFADVDTGDTLAAIKVTSLPAHGTLNLGVTPITSVPSAAILVANIGNLTYTPATNYSGPDSFNFQVRDATVFSADAIMAITVNYAISIAVQNGGFENPTPHEPNNGTNADWTAGGWAFVGSPWTASTGGYGRLSQGPVASPQLGNWMMNLCDQGGWVKQDLGTTVNTGDTLAVTFHVMVDKIFTDPRSAMDAAFVVGSTEYGQTFDTSNQAANAWVPITLTKTIAVSGKLSVIFRNHGIEADRAPYPWGVGNISRAWLDNISNVSVTPSGGSPTITGGTLSGALSTTYGTASSPATFTLSGANMSAGILVTAPTGFEVSKSAGSGYATTTTVGAAGTISSTTVYVRLSATAPASGSYNSKNIVLSSSGATAVNVTTTASGNSVGKATPTATLTVSNSPATYDGSPKAAAVTLTASSVPGAVQIILTGGAATRTAAATYTVTANFVPTDTANYNTLTAQGAGNFVIAKATPTLSVTNSPVAYLESQQQGATVIGSVAGTVSNVKYNGSATVPTAVGSYVVTADFVPSDAANFSSLSAAPAGNFIIASGSGSYAGWATANGATGQTMEQDHDHDGVPNGIEYFLGGNANTTGFTPLPGVNQASDGKLSVTWTKAADYPGVYGTGYVVQTTTSLATDTWTNEPGSGNVTFSGNEVIYTFPSTGPAKKFARLKVISTP